MGGLTVGMILDATYSTVTVTNLTVLDMIAQTFGGLISLSILSTGYFTNINLIRVEVDLLLGSGPNGIFDDMGLFSGIFNCISDTTCSY